MNINTKNQNINKKELINILHAKSSLSFNQINEGVESILEFFEAKFKEDCTIEIRGFGKFTNKNGKIKFKSFIFY